jgi:hypothetical protein
MRENGTKGVEMKVGKKSKAERGRASNVEKEIPNAGHNLPNPHQFELLSW